MHSSDVRLFTDDRLLYKHIACDQDSTSHQDNLTALEHWGPCGKCSSIQRNVYLSGLAQTQGWSGKSLLSSWSYSRSRRQLVNILEWQSARILMEATHRCHSRKRPADPWIHTKKSQGMLPKVKKTEYTTLVRPSLEYTSSVWDLHTTVDAQHIEQVQQKAARFAYNNYTDRWPGRVSNMLHDLGWEPLEDRRRNHRLSRHESNLETFWIQTCSSKVKINNQTKNLCVHL